MEWSVNGQPLILCKFNNPLYLSFYTQLQKKPISHLFGELWKIEVRNEIYIYHSPQQSICMNSLNNVTVLFKSAHAVRQC